MSDVSVVVCTMDRPEALARCVGALRACTPPPAQIVVVDQGTRPVALEGVDYLRMAERGVSRGRNRGADAATQELLAFTDDDCVPAPARGRWSSRRKAAAGRCCGTRPRRRPTRPTAPSAGAVYSCVATA